MIRSCKLILVLALAAGCASSHSRKSPSDAQANPGAPPRGFKVVGGVDPGQAEVDALVSFIEQLKRRGEDIDRITQVQFSSPSEAKVRFLWSGGFHGGMLMAIKKNGAWTLKDVEYYP